MKANIGKYDKTIRVVFSLILFSSFFLLEGDLKYLAFIGVIPLVTSLVSFCPLYSLVGINTCKLKK